MLIEQQGEYENEAFAEIELTIIWDEVSNGQYTWNTCLIKQACMIVNAESQLQLRVVPAYGYLIWLRQEKQASFKMPVLAGVSGSPAAIHNR